ncbi:MAG: SIS domain-containing protein [Patescibacteria group bacterium]|nr:SIS domain-containing protein [Patescibacteria group bacterium]MDD5295099.1 SIS domain-containing protein [Patescibacteria group bacterium]MDD5554082.1 SIS domain-containing protein [Patescibacteria group bacterium]
MKLNNLILPRKGEVGRLVESIQFLPDQVRQVLTEARLIKIPASYSQINEVVVNGMGGSNLGAGIVKAVFSDKMNAPLTITPGYQVPAHVGRNTLYIISSYSGSTEEPLSVYQEVKKRGAKIAAITSAGNGKLEKLMIKDNIPGYIFKPEFNPSCQPRLGVGYMIFGLAVMLAKAGLFKIKVKEIEDLIADLEIWDRRLRPAIATKNNQAKKIAEALFGRQPILVGAEFLIGNLRVLRNQLCENSKNFASYLTLPELNHYALESLANPRSNKKDLIFFFLDSKLYHPRVEKRSRLTKQVAKKSGIKVFGYTLTGKTKLVQAFEMLQLGTWVSFYLAVLNKVNPAEIAWVDWFKKQLR